MLATSWIVMKTWRGLHEGVGVFSTENAARRCARKLRENSQCDPDEVSVVRVTPNHFVSVQ